MQIQLCFRLSLRIRRIFLHTCEYVLHYKCYVYFYTYFLVTGDFLYYYGTPIFYLTRCQSARQEESYQKTEVQNVHLKTYYYFTTIIYYYYYNIYIRVTVLLNQTRNTIPPHFSFGLIKSTNQHVLSTTTVERRLVRKIANTYQPTDFY